jgi:dienelactone hydrolase
VRTIELSFAGAAGERVPATLTLPESEKPVPCVILVHGLGGSRSDLQLLSLPLIGKGWATLSIDLPGHGERVKKGDKPLSALTLSELRALAARSVVDLRRATDYLSSRKEVDKDRIGLVGISLGAILGADFLATEPRVRCAAFWSGGAGWGELLTESEHELAKKWRSGVEGDRAAIERAMADVDPKVLLPKSRPRPLLFLWGDADTVVPTKTSQALFDAALSPKEKVVLPGAHVPDPLGMAGKTAAFLETNF